MESNRESEDRRDEAGRRELVKRRHELVLVPVDSRINLDRRIPYIRRGRVNRRAVMPLPN